MILLSEQEQEKKKQKKKKKKQQVVLETEVESELPELIDALVELEKEKNMLTFKSALIVKVPRFAE